MPENYASVETDNMAVSSNSETREEIEEILGVTPKKEEAKPEETPEEKPAAKSAESAESADRDEKGRFKAKPIPDKPEEKPEGKPDENAKPEEKAAEAPKGEETKPAEAEKVEPKKTARPDARQRVEQATRAAAEERRRADGYERENRALRAAARQEAPQPQPKPQSGDAPPELTEGKDPAEFVRETAKWAAQQEQRGADQRRQAEARAGRFHQEVAKREEKFGKAWQEREAKEPGFKDRIRPELLELEPTFNLQDGQKPTVWNAFAAEITDSSVPVEILIYLSENEDEYQRVATLGPRELTRAIAKWEAKLEAATAGTPAPEIPPFTPSAAQPVTPVTGAATTADGPPDVETASFEEWYKYHNEQEKKRRRA